MFAAAEPTTGPLARALIACDRLLEEAIEGEIEPTEWTIDELTALRDDVHALLVAEAFGDVA
ncbi:MAG: hypothetical protein ICV71_02615 [Thermoleophilia bacterium]|nr:hypothetical protein [Thermoleophilia bacterium]MDQ3857238.1 hypothetical protein [Actinomycetota bacterium]